ncbi:MAG: TIGR03986 family CRISPR-associated RAMP protein, partial [Acidobacteriota bacterium]
MSFKNPYHFVPLECTIPNSIDLPEKGAAFTSTLLAHRTFDQYHQGTHSGRIVCVVETCGPVVIGSQQSDDADGYTRVHPFERNQKPALPATSLRGCISSLAEAASNSALRVLEDTYYSRRVIFNDDVRPEPQHFSAIGMIVEENGELRLRPFAAPTLYAGGGGWFELPRPYRIMFPDSDVKLKAYCSRSTIGTAPKAYSARNREFVYARLDGSYSLGTGFRVTGSGGKMRGASILLGARVRGAIRKKCFPSSTRGIMRVLFSPRRTDIPRTKTHELFLPYPKGAEKWPTFPIQKEALKRFERMARAREEENNRRARSGQDPLPYALKGAQPFKDRRPPYRLAGGDIVFFRPNRRGDEVEELWVSQLWRKEIEGSAHDYFSEVNPELLPFNPERKTITPAEALFGLVEELEEGKSDQEKARALAGRLRFSDGELIQKPEEDCYHNWTPLKILASPKPPCPSFYFRRKTLSRNPAPGTLFTAKKDLGLATHIPQGRKFYLHQSIDPKKPPYRTERPGEDQKLKNRVRPLRKGWAFRF